MFIVIFIVGTVYATGFGLACTDVILEHSAARTLGRSPGAIPQTNNQPAFEAAIYIRLVRTIRGAVARTERPSPGATAGNLSLP